MNSSLTLLSSSIPRSVESTSQLASALSSIFRNTSCLAYRTSAGNVGSPDGFLLYVVVQTFADLKFQFVPCLENFHCVRILHITTHVIQLVDGSERCPKMTWLNLNCCPNSAGCGGPLEMSVVDLVCY